MKNRNRPIRSDKPTASLITTTQNQSHYTKPPTTKASWTFWMLTALLLWGTVGAGGATLRGFLG